VGSLTEVILLVIGGFLVIGFIYFGFVSIREHEKRAARRAFLLAIGTALLFVLASFLNPTGQTIVLMMIAIILLVLAVLFFLPIGKISHAYKAPESRFDERDVIFSRFFRLTPGSPEFESYYLRRPENKASDALTRTKPGLNTPGSLFWNPFLAAAVGASFFLTEGMSGSVDGAVAENQVSLPLQQMTDFIKNLARYYGGLTVGITELKPYHVYSHVGRGEGVYGDPIPVEHKYAVAITVEMDHDMIGPNPRLQGSMESAHQYVEGGRVAVQLAAYIRFLGYPARAHIDGNYQVICPLVARDAGLGELGRMGLLMTPSHGPRIRLAVVTTDLELLTDTPLDGRDVIDFCTVCKKCANTCPSQSIPFDDRKEIDGVLRWKIDADTCFRYWSTSGTDCGRCMSVCPYSHPATFSHNVIRWGVEHSGFLRRAVNWMDDFFYGVNPARRPVPSWTSAATQYGRRLRDQETTHIEEKY